MLLTQSGSFAQYADKYVASSSSVVIDGASFRVIITPASGSASGSTLVDLSIDKLPDVPVAIYLRDDDRHTLLTQQVRTDAPLLVRRLDLRELDNGTYWLTVQVGKKRFVRKLKLVSLSASEQIVVLE